MEPLKAIIVEDNPEFVYFVKEVLNRIGFETYEAQEFDAFNVLMSERAYDIVILDWSLKGDKDGIQCIQAVKKWETYFDYRAPILMLTGFDGAHAEKHALKMGADAFLKKGRVSPSDILEAVRLVIQKVNPQTDLKNLTFDLS